MRFSIFFAAVMYLSVSHTYAQDFYISAESHYLVERKAGFENARCFIQDQDGFFWIGTSQGILRYNDHEVDRLEDLLIRESPVLHNITALHLDSGNTIWIAAGGKINRLRLSAMMIDEIQMTIGDSTISRLPDINDLQLIDDNRLLVTTDQGLFILSRSAEDNVWNVSHFRELRPTVPESRFLDSLQASAPMLSSLVLRDSLQHSVKFSVGDSSEFLIMSTSPKMFSSITEVNDVAWIENQSGERIWTKYDDFYFLSSHPTIVSMSPGRYTLHGQLKLYDYFRDVLPKYEVRIYELDEKSARLFRRIKHDWQNRRSIVEDDTGEILADQEGTFWITGGGGLTSLRFDEGKSVFNVYTPHEGKEFGQHGIHTFTVKQSRGNGFWVLGRGYSDLEQLRQGKNAFGRNHIMFYKSDRQRFSRLSYEGTNVIADIAEDADSSLWLLQENGILNRIKFHKTALMDPQRVDQLELSEFGRASNLIIDRSDNLWVLTEKQGLIKITRSKNLSSWRWPHDQLLIGNPTNELDEFLLFTGDGSVFKSTTRGMALDASMLGTLEQPVIDFLRFSDTSAVAVTRRGTIFFLNNHWKSSGSIRIDSLPSNPRLPMGAIRLRRTSEDSVYLCTNQGLFTINVRTKKISPNLFDPQPVLVPMISDVFSHHGKRLAVVNIHSGSRGNSGYIVPVDASARKKGFINREYSNLGTEINAVVHWSDRIMVGSQLGVHEYLPDKDTFLLVSPWGYPPVYNMIADDDGFIWTVGNDGITCLNSNSRNFQTVVPKLFLPEKRFNDLSPALWQSDSAHIHFAANNRLYRLRFNSARAQENKVRVQIDNLVVQSSPGENRRVKPVHNIIVLRPGQHTFTVDFAAADLESPDRSYFSYRLMGYHENWINTTHSEIQFINVPPGEYTLELRVIDGLRTSATSLSLRLKSFWWQTMAARVLFGAVVLLVIWWSWYTNARHNRLRRKLEQEQVEKDKISMMSQMRSRFFANISHEFRTPLTLISGPIEDRIKGEKDPSERKALSRVLDQVRRMLKLVNELLDLSKLESGRLPVETKAGDIMQYVNSIAESFNNAAAEKELKYTVTIPPKLVFLEFDPEQMAKILVNLLSNAIKFSPVGGNVSLEVGYDNKTQQFLIDVGNEGKPIPDGELSLIFNPFYRAGNAQSQGSGIGLALVKELVDNMNGTIEAYSDPVHGNMFRVVLPLHQAKNLESESKARLLRSNIPSDAPFSVKGQLENYQLLIVEDDEEMRDYVCSIFTSAEPPLTAGNGETGFKLAVETIPDLIICDVMMPGLDGIACCEKLKSDPRTDHIPIILLTAKTELGDRIDGLRAGADDYITKPFSSEELRIKVNNLINQRNQLKTRFSRHIQSTYKDLPMKSSDERFLDKAISVVYNQMSNSEFDITQFSSAMNLSRTHLYKKLKVITDQSPSEFIRNLRLQRAAELLAAGTDQVSLIAYDTGFNNLSYFTRAFKNKYGVPPTEYKRQSFANS